MVININFKDQDFTTAEIEDTIKDSFNKEIQFAKIKLDRYSRICKNFETKHEMTTEEFLSKFEGGQLSEDDDYFDWYAAKRGVDEWSKKYMPSYIHNSIKGDIR
jgi:hypothetical protein